MKRFIVGFIPLSFTAGRPAMACVLAAALLACASSSHSQVIEEGGFPVKGGDNSGEPFSLSCPPRLVAQAGESVLFSCTATAVPEEGVRYAWEPVSGDGLHLLSDAQALTPLFTAPLSGEGVEYAYRLTAMSVGVYETATVTVIVGVSGGSVQDRGKSPGLLEGCDAFGAFEGFREGCVAGDKMPPSFEPFEGGFEGEGGPGFLFPEVPDRPSGPVRGGGPGPQAPPRLECPVAVFLEELETGQVECHAWDASGEEYLEYSWEPVGSTTRDYLDNPRLIPEDSPTPSVVAPETPAYETLESFRSGETTFRYRYRLTATSRATGLSSSSEVEVYVSSSRPSVYCPLEVVVEEGETIALDCEGVDPLSHRMDYDEESASVLWEWEGLWATSTAPLAAKDLSSPLFTAPAGSAGKEYHYIASMTSSASGVPRTARRKVTVRVVGEEDVSGPTDDFYIDCPDNDFEMYEGEASDGSRIIICSKSPYKPPKHYMTSRQTYKSVASSPNAVMGTTGRASQPILAIGIAWWRNSVPQFTAPPVSEDTKYVFSIRLCPRSLPEPCSEEDALASDDVTVIVLDGTRPAVTCNTPAPVYEAAADFALDCSVTNEPEGAAYNWTGTDIADRLTDTDGLAPTFSVPDNVDSDTDYEYRVTLSVNGVVQNSTDVTVRVLNRRLDVTCTDPSVYEGNSDFALHCEVDESVLQAGHEATWNWEPTDRLVDHDTGTPTFDVPAEVHSDTEYRYAVTATAEDVEAGTATVTVRVLDRRDIVVSCTVASYEVYEGSADVAFDCSASGAPSGSAYSYYWTPRGDTQDTSLLSATGTASPTFYVPEEVDRATTYEYLLTASADNAEDGAARVAVTVLNREPLAARCADPGSVYEGSADIAFDCEASGAPAGSTYEYAWTPRGDTQDTSLLSAADIASPTFLVLEEVNETTTYEYLLTASADNAEDGAAAVAVTVLNREPLAVRCAVPGSIYEGSADFELDCSASGAPSGSDYSYSWTAIGATANTDRLSAVDIASPTFYVPEEVDRATTYEYLLTASAENAEDGAAEVAVRVLNKEPLAVRCAVPGSIYEGSEDIAFDCSASDAPGDSPEYTYVWTPLGDTQDTSLLSAADTASPTFHVPEEVNETTTYEYLLTASADNAEDGAAQVAVTVLNREPLAARCAAPGSVYEGSADFELDCSASDAPGDSPEYTYVWTPLGDTQDTSLLSAADIASPTFAVPEEVNETMTYEYLLTASADNAEDATAEVTVTVLNKEPLAARCAAPGSVYEGSADFELDCSASDAPGDSPEYTYVWTPLGDTQDTSLLSAVDIASPTFLVPEEVNETTTYEYLLTASADNAEDATAEVTVTVLNKEPLAARCAAPGSVYEGSADFDLDCSASDAPGDSPEYTYVWTPLGDTQDTSLLSAVDIASPTFYVPEEVNETMTYEYLLTASADNAEDATAEVTVTVLNKEPLAARCAAPGSVYEGSADFDLDCSASDAPGDSPEYTYVWTPLGDTQDTSLLSAADIASPTFLVPEEVNETTTYEYLLTASADNAEDATAEVTVTVLDRLQMSLSDPSALGVTVSASPLRFGVQSADTQVSLDPMTDQISTRVSGPYHAGRMTLAPGGSEENLSLGEEMNLSIEIASPVFLKRADAIEASSLVLTPQWSLAESCEQLSSQTIGGLYTEVTLSDVDCRLLRFGGELYLTDIPSGRYAGRMDIILRSGESEETHSVDVEVRVVPAQQVITIGPRGVRFSTSREIPAGLTEEQNLSIYPHVAFLTEGKPHGVFELSNPSLIPLEISVSARFGYTEATENGREVVVEDASGSHLSDLSEVVDIHPGVLVLMPGEKGLVRYGVKEGALTAMAEKGYAAFFDVVSSPRQYVRSDQMPEEVSGDRTARVTMRVPGVYVPGEGASQLRATLLSISYVGFLSATFLLETQDHPFVGEVVAYDGDGRELGRRETLVYTRSRVRIPLDRMPEEGAVFLRFSPRGSGRVPEPASVEWYAPRRDIGDAENEGRKTIPATLVQKP